MKEVEILKALADENRVKILKMLRCGEMCVCDILDYLDLSQPTVSHHLKILYNAGLINYRKGGKWIYYSLNKSRIEELMDFLKELLVVPEKCDYKRRNCEEKEE